MNPKSKAKYRTAEDVLFDAWGLSRDEHWIPVQGGDFQVRAQVAGSGPAVLFIHGGPNGGSTWVPLAASLRKKYRCILLDRPGSGLSQPPATGPASPDALGHLIESTLDAVLDYFGCDSVVLAGSSFGGYWALRYALSRPHRVERMVQQGCPALVEGMRVPDFMKAFVHPILGRLISLMPLTPFFGKKIMRDIGHGASLRNGRIREVFLRWYLALANHTDTMRHEIANIRNVLGGGRMKPEYVLSLGDLRQIECPVLWLWGEDDPFGDVALGRRLHSQMKRSSFVSFPESGHLPWLDDPPAHAAQIAAFASGGLGGAAAGQ